MPPDDDTNPPIGPRPIVVALDVFGTLLHIRDKRRPYQALFVALGVDGAAAARVAMTQNLPVEELAARLRPGADIDLSEIRAGIQAEVDSVEPFPEVAPSLEALTQAGFRLALVSNLAPPYARVVLEKLPPVFEATVFSFEVGSVKPEPAIYEVLCKRLNVAPSQVLMVGDRRRDDVDGARSLGMSALHLDRSRGSSAGADRISDLTGLVDRLCDRGATGSVPTSARAHNAGRKVTPQP